MQQLWSGWMDFHDIWYWGVLWKSVNRFQFWLKSDMRHTAWRPTHVSVHRNDQMGNPQPFERSWGITHNDTANQTGTIYLADTKVLGITSVTCQNCYVVRTFPNLFILHFLIKMTVFWNVLLYNLLEIDQHFRSACCLHRQGGKSVSIRCNIPVDFRLAFYCLFQANRYHLISI
jgi:hypothetical protein